MKDFHFVFGLRPQAEPFHLVHWLCLESCRQVNDPCTLHLHLQHEPWGPLWEQIRPHVRIHRVAPLDRGAWQARYEGSDEGRLIKHAGWDVAHDADFVRLDVLLREGGIYADMDTMFVRPYPELLTDTDFAMAEEVPTPDMRGLLRPSLCNAVLFSRPGARFARLWRTRMDEAFDGRWSSHSCQLATEMWPEEASHLQVLPSVSCYHFQADQRGLAELFTEVAQVPQEVCSIHLWAHLWWDAWRTDFTSFHAGLITEQWLRESPVTYAVLARQYL